MAVARTVTSSKVGDQSWSATTKFVTGEDMNTVPGRRENHPGTTCRVSKTLCKLFFRPTPLGFRQVVQHVRLHVA